VTLAPAPDVAATVMSVGSAITGGAVSVVRTVTLNVALPVLRAASVAVQRTVVVPTPKVLPLAGVHVGVSAPSTPSRAVAV